MPLSLSGRSPAVAATVCAALVLGGCGGSSKATPTTADSTSAFEATTVSSPPSLTATTSPASASPTLLPVDVVAQRIFAKSKAATASVVSLRVVDTVVRGGATQRLDLLFGRTGTAGHITRGGYTFDILFIGDTFYFRAPAAFIRAQYKSKIPLAVKRTEGKYVASPAAGSSATPYRSLANRSAVLAGVYYAHPNLRRGPKKRVDGVSCIALVDPGKGTFYVRADNALPVEIDSTVTDGSKLIFSEFNRVADPKIPPVGQAVDSKGNPV